MQSLFKRFGVALLAVALLAFLFHLNDVEKPQLVNTQGRSFERATVTRILRDNLQENGSRIGDQIVRLHFADGTESEANCPNGLLFGTVCEPGMSVVVIASKTGTLSSYTVYSYDRMTAVAGFLAFFARAGTSKGISGLIQPVTKEGLRFERSPSFSPFFLLLSSSITGSVHELAVLRYGYDTGLAALVVGDSIGSVAADGRVRHVLDLSLRVQGLHDVCRDLLADFRRALQHEQATPYA